MDNCICSCNHTADGLHTLLVYTHTHTTILLLCWSLSGTTRVSRYQKGINQEG